MRTEAALDRVKSVVGPRGWIDDPRDQEPYLVKARGLYRGGTRLVVRPAATAEVAAVVRICAEAGLAIVPQGGNTGLVGRGVIAGSGAQAKELWRIREAIVEAQLYSDSIKHDVSVPVSRVADFVTQASAAVCTRLPGIRPIAFGHVGDGNIHFNLTQPKGMDKAAYLARWQEFNDIVHGVMRKLHGLISAEHSVRMMKRDEITHYKPAVGWRKLGLRPLAGPASVLIADAV